MRTEGRWELAKQEALRSLRTLVDGDRAALLMMHPSPHWLVPMTDDLSTVRTALEATGPGFEKTSYAPALRLASQTLAATPARLRVLVWMADEQRLGWSGVDRKHPLPPGVEFRPVQPMASPERQAAIQSVARTAEGASVTIRLFSPPEETREISVFAGATRLNGKSVTLHEGDNTVALAFDVPDATTAVRIEMTPDALPADDVAWLAWNPALADTVHLDRTSGTDFLAHALESTSKLGTAPLKTAPLPGGNWPRDGVVIVRDATTFATPAASKIETYLAAGGAAWIFVNGSSGKTA